MATSEKLSIKGWMTAVGISAYDLEKQAGCTTQTIRAAQDPAGYGSPISAKVAEAILKVLSERHGKTIQLSDVKDLAVI